MPATIWQYDWTAPWTGGTVSENGTPLTSGIVDFNPIGNWSVGARPASVTINVSASVSRQVAVTVYDAVAVLIGNVTITYPIGNSTIVVPLTFAANDLVRMRVTQSVANNFNDMFIDSLDVAGITAVGFCFWTVAPGETENC